MPLLLYEIENGLLSRPARLAARLLYLTVHSVLTDRYIQYGRETWAEAWGDALMKFMDYCAEKAIGQILVKDGNRQTER